MKPAEKLTTAQAQKAVWVSGNKRAGYWLHIYLEGVETTVPLTDYRTAISLQRAMRNVLTGETA